MATTDPSPQSSAALDRIHRLERQERARLDRLDEIRRQREAALDSAAGEKPDRRRRVERVEHALRFPMAVLGLAWAVLAIIVLTTDSKHTSPKLTVTILFIVWAVIVIECLVRYVAVPNRREYFSSRMVEPALVIVPAFQISRVAGVERVTVLLQELGEVSLAILRHRSLFRVLLAALALLILGAWLVMLFEANAPGSNIHTFKDAIWWAVVTVTTVGYGDRFPVTEGGRAVAVVLMFVGIGLIGTLTATVASFFVQEHTDANRDQLKAAHEDLGAQLGDIADRLARLEAAGGIPPGPADDTPPSPPTNGK